ncbi:LOW QUALITY PROTEIN: hypothetical protein SPRG_03128 [Saprolegnia parasitica CBS 223.65]|uniref:Uncharacterized protein n=1 Tax=Saprolegnia parasitica (strain CBS 223.65) TaxID=695850 RepID=A0A067CYM7_SAPPC|nr:LOW QUALITY PROTEIN: hypothetical protein SPRG_03128 [Saprolegnia parasitica CBS 223.65]KDO31912.1 LOW QUALITY PROTEIN: hypothetical protein SPRG_03128 [Saprolegnia parasitica CBS 223.65]|eukprot:XP_012197111.1 LOW QUALITY PROTEIN: hypothetical protein SPRG_03128 [Saprolegnia parasitica CBS 223.65]
MQFFPSIEMHAAARLSSARVALFRRYSRNMANPKPILTGKCFLERALTKNGLSHNLCDFNPVEVAIGVLAVASTAKSKTKTSAGSTI